MALPKLAPVQPAHDKLRALGIVALNGMFDDMDALGVLRYAISDVLPGDVAIVSSFGADSSVLLHLVAQVDPSMPVYFLETGKHFTQLRRNRPGSLGRGIGEHINQFAGDQQLVAAKDRGAECHR